jgi:hypothetical protein
MLPFPPREEKPSRPEPETEVDSGHWHSSDEHNPGEDWGPFRTALGLMAVGTLLVLGSGVFLFLYVQWPSTSSAGGRTAALVAATAGLVGLVLMGTGLVLTHNVPASTGFRSTCKVCCVALLSTLALAIVLVHALVANELARHRNSSGLLRESVPLWSNGTLLALSAAAFLLLALTMVLWLVLLAHVARHFQCWFLAWTFYGFLGLSALVALLNFLVGAAADRSYATFNEPPTHYSAGFAIDDEYGMVHANVVTVSLGATHPPALAWLRALVGITLMLIHLLLVLLVRRATFAWSGGPTFEVTPAEIPSDWRWDHNQPGD